MDNRQIQKNVCHTGSRHTHKKGPSSYWMHNPVRIYQELDLKEGGDIFLDIGCGSGDYSVAAAREVGMEGGHVYATDIQPHLLEGLRTRAASLDLENLTAISSDIRKPPLPFDDKSIDLCFISTVLHAVDLAAIREMLFSEIHRILKTGGRLVIIECKKKRHRSVRLYRCESLPKKLRHQYRNMGLHRPG